ncbi:MAG: AAA family ATPase [Proteobacteria bacterium]|nr:AAA family ATPase [Pseudomonadota bacterium]
MSRPEPDVRKCAVGGVPKLTRFADIEERKLEWLWPGRIPVGKLTVIAGEPGLGKSLVTIAIASAVTNQARWPDCSENAPYGSVILLSAEDDDADTVKPRLLAAGADPHKVLSFDSVIYEPDGSRRGFTLDGDFDKLAQAIKIVSDCRLVVIDPVSAFMGSVDSHKNSDVRGVLSILADIAQEYRVAILCVTHLNKGQGSPMSRVTGSGAFVAAARSALLVGADPEEPDRRIVAMLKANLAKESDGVAYRIRSNEDDLPVVEWEPGRVDIRPADILAHEPDEARRERSDAAEWLCSELSHGPVLTNDLQRRSRAAGHAWRTVRRAKDQIGVKARRTGVGGKWQWWHPDDLPEDGHMAPSQNVGQVGHVGHLEVEDGQGGQDSGTGKVGQVEEETRL